MNRSIRRHAEYDAERARSKAFWRHVLHSLRGVPNDLLPFEAVRRLQPQAESYTGVRSIEIDRIVGSVDRYRDFDHYFLPRLNLPLERWIGIRAARLQGLELPAIEVYQVGDVYFVKDGHHRVSVAREAGQRFIDAEIVELKVTVPPEAHDTVEDIIHKGEYAEFLNATGLSRLRPDHAAIRFSVPGRFETLLQHIRTRQYYLGCERRREVPWDEAVADWYDNLYQPLVAAIRLHRVLERFPGRTEADLYHWIMDHRHFLSERSGSDPGSERAALDYASRFAPDPLRRAWQRVAHAWGRPQR